MRSQALTREPSIKDLLSDSASACAVRRVLRGVLISKYIVSRPRKELIRKQCKGAIATTWRERVSPREKQHTRQVSVVGATALTSRRIAGTSRLNASSLNRTEVQGQKKATNTQEVIFPRMRRVRVAHAMDPVQRAGQTVESNIREYSRYRGKGKRRRNRKKRKSVPFMKLLLNLLFIMVFPKVFHGNFLIKHILKGLEKQSAQHEKKKSNSCKVRSSLLASR